MVIRKTIVIWALFLLGDLLIAGGISEAWIRLFIPVTNICYYHDPVLGDMTCPNQQTYGYVEKGYSNILATNSLGFHDIERHKEKQKGTLRIHIYGDSLIGGVGVPLNKTIPSLAETNLNKNDLPMSVEVLNMATAEDSTCAAFTAYKVIGKDFSPDVVICYFMNDFHDNIFETHQRTRSPYYEINPEGELIFVPPLSVDTTTPWEQFKRSSLLYRLLANKLLASKLYHNINQQLNNARYYFRADVNTSNNEGESFAETRKMVLREKGWPTTLRILQEFNAEVEKNGAKFVLVDGTPFEEGFSGGYTNKDLKAFCDKNSIQYIPVYDEYMRLKKDKNKAKYFLEDGHPTILGNEIISQQLAQKLKEQFLSERLWLKTNAK